MFLQHSDSYTVPVADHANKTSIELAIKEVVKHDDVQSCSNLRPHLGPAIWS